MTAAYEGISHVVSTLPVLWLLLLSRSFFNCLALGKGHDARYRTSRSEAIASRLEAIAIAMRNKEKEKEERSNIGCISLLTY